MSRNFRDVLLDRVCQHKTGIRMLFGFCITFVLLMLGSLSVVERGSGSYVIAVLNLVGLSIIAIVSGAVLLFCRNRRE